jgi:uncharacterized membrane protein YjgN (DUF898 family)
MAYFRNNTVNLLNLHYGLHSFALSGSSAFFGVFLLKSGVPAPLVLVSIAAIVALVVMAATTTLRAVSVGNAPLAVLANASGALVACLYVPVLGTAIYNQAKHSPCTLRFHIASEAGWDLGGASVLLAAAGLLQAGVPIGTCILLSLLGALASLYLLRTYFSALKPAI